MAKGRHYNEDGTEAKPPFAEDSSLPNFIKLKPLGAKPTTTPKPLSLLERRSSALRQSTSFTSEGGEAPGDNNLPPDSTLLGMSSLIFDPDEKETATVFVIQAPGDNTDLGDANYQDGEDGKKRGHNTATVETSPGRTKYYCKTTIVSDVAGAINTQKEEVFLHDLQKLLMPEVVAINYLKYSKVGVDKFQTEMRDGACNLEEFLQKIIRGEIPRPEGFIPGLATSMVLKALLQDRDNKLSNYLVYLSAMPGKYLAIGIDAELILDSPICAVYTAKNGIQGFIDTIRTTSENKKLLATLADPKEIEDLFKRTVLHRSALSDLVNATFSPTDDKYTTITKSLDTVMQWYPTTTNNPSTFQLTSPPAIEQGVVDRTEVPKEATEFGIMGRTGYVPSTSFAERHTNSQAHFVRR